MPEEKYISYNNLKRFKNDLNPVFAKKQDVLNNDQLAAVNSGVTAEKIAVYDTIEGKAIGEVSVVKTTKTGKNILTFKTYNLEETLLDTTVVELPSGASVTGLSYTEETKTITLNLSDNTSFSITLSNLVTQADLDELKEAIEEQLGYVYEYDDTATSINYVFEKLTDKTYLNEVSSIALTIPSTADQGFESSVIFKTGDTNPPFNITNLTDFPIKMVQFGRQITSYTPSTHSTITILFYNDKINNNILIYEVSDSI